MFSLFVPTLIVVTGPRRSRNRGKGRMNASTSKPTTLQFESDFDFETANAQFNKEDIEKEIQEKLNVKGLFPWILPRPCQMFLNPVAFEITSIPNHWAGFKSGDLSTLSLFLLDRSEE